MEKRTIARTSCVILLAAAVLLLAAACGGSEGTVRGVVTQAKDPQQALNDPDNVGEPLADANVVVYVLNRVEAAKKQEIYTKGLVAYKGVSGEDGAYSFTAAPGKYVIEIQVNGATVGNRQVEVKAGKTSVADFNVKLP